MSSTTDLKSDSIWSADGKYHLVFIYLVHDDGYCGGGYDAEHFKLFAAVGGETIEKMIDEAYDHLEEHLEDEKDLPFDIKNLKESVVFDLVQCLNAEEQWAALRLKRNGATSEDINNAVRK